MEVDSGGDCSSPGVPLKKKTDLNRLFQIAESATVRSTMAKDRRKFQTNAPAIIWYPFHQTEFFFSHCACIIYRSKSASNNRIQGSTGDRSLKPEDLVVTAGGRCLRWAAAQVTLDLLAVAEMILHTPAAKRRRHRWSVARLLAPLQSCAHASTRRRPGSPSSSSSTAPMPNSLCSYHIFCVVICDMRGYNP